MSINPPSPPHNLDFWVDASTSFDIGVVLQGLWNGWCLWPGWKSDGRDIGWAEMAAVQIGLELLLASGIRNTHVTLRSDNTGIIGTLCHHKSYS